MQNMLSCNRLLDYLSVAVYPWLYRLFTLLAQKTLNCGVDSALGSIDRNKLNVVGSSLAVGHPFAATGARIVGTLAKLLHTSGKKRGLISICTAGGMGVAAILESV